MVNHNTVLARLREQRIAHNTAIIGVCVDGVSGGFLELSELGSDVGHELGILHGESVEAPVHPVAGRSRVSLTHSSPR